MSQFENARILIIGGDSNFAYLIRSYVRMSSHQIILANLAEDIPALVQREKPNVIVLEVDLPDSIGWQVLRTIRDTPATSKTPVLLCSWMEDEQRGLDEGADVYLHMPIMYKDFAAALESVGIPSYLEPDAAGN
jgi:two-component system, chemotaxis family, response regulator PixH